MTRRPAVVHLVGILAAGVVSIVLLSTLVPFLVNLVFPPAARTAGIRAVPIYYLALALIPAIFWLVPPFVRALARGSFGSHKLVLGKSGFYLRFPLRRKVRFRDTVLMSLGPFALDLLVISEVTYFVSLPDVRLLGRGLVAIPALFVLAGLLTALVPGAWLLGALDIRLVNPSKGEVVRTAELFESVLGPVGAIALLASFITTLHAVNYSYEQGLVGLGEWAVRLFPPVLLAVSVYRLVVEPDVLPSLEAWCEREGIPVQDSLSDVLSELRPSAAVGAHAEPPESEVPPEQAK
jgi:hypothetical protein